MTLKYGYVPVKCYASAQPRELTQGRFSVTFGGVPIWREQEMQGVELGEAFYRATEHTFFLMCSGHVSVTQTFRHRGENMFLMGGLYIRYPDLAA